MTTMNTFTSYDGVQALEYGITCRKAVVLDERPWRYLKRQRDHSWTESERPLQRRDGLDAGLLVLCGRYTSIHGEPGDDVLLSFAQQIREDGALDYCARHRRWPAWVQAWLEAHKLEIVVRSAGRLIGTWEAYTRHEAEQDVIYEAEGIAADVVEAEQEAAHQRLVSDVERRLLRAGVTFTTSMKPPPGAERHPRTGDLLNALGKVMAEADVHEDCYGTGVVMSYETLLRLLKMIDPRYEVS